MLDSNLSCALYLLADALGTTFSAGYSSARADGAASLSFEECSPASTLQNQENVMATQRGDLRELLREVKEATSLLNASKNVSDDIKESLNSLVDRVDSSEAHFEELSAENHQELLANLHGLKDAIVSAIHDGARTAGGMAAGGALIAGLIQVMMPQLAAQHQLENTFKILLTVLRPGTSATRQELRRAFNLCNVPLGQAKSLVELLLERGFLEECDNDERIRISEAGVRLFHDKYGHGLKELGWR